MTFSSRKSEASGGIPKEERVLSGGFLSRYRSLEMTAEPMNLSRFPCCLLSVLGLKVGNVPAGNKGEYKNKVNPLRRGHKGPASSPFVPCG